MGQVVCIKEQSYLIYLRQYLSLIGFIWITYNLKSPTSKRKKQYCIHIEYLNSFNQEDVRSLQDAKVLS